MPTVAVLHHLEEAATGHAGPVLRAAGAELDERDLPGGDPLPELDSVDAVLSLGGRQSLLEIERYPYLLAELELLAEAVERGLPVLGVCLGGQLLAHAHGAEVRRLSERRIGWPEVETAEGAGEDPLFGGLPERFPVLHWNEDYFEVPDSAVELLSRSADGGEAFRIGDRAWGIQFHPEADSAMLDEWYCRGPEALEQAGVSEEEARAADQANAASQWALAERLFGSFARLAGT